jgi:hypothetical protein
MLPLCGTSQNSTSKADEGYFCGNISYYIIAFYDFKAYNSNID